MYKPVRTFFIFAAIWFIASLLNGMLSGICIALTGWEMIDSVPGTVFLCCIFSLLFSLPLVGLVWLVTAVAQACGKKGAILFQLILKTTLFAAVVGAFLFFQSFSHQFKEAAIAVACCIVFSAMASVLSFRHKLKADE